MRKTLGTICLLMLFATTLAEAQIFQGGPMARAKAAEMVSGVAVHDWPDSPKRFGDAQRMADAKEWRKSAELYQEILEKFGDRLLVNESSDGTGYTNVARVVQQKLAKWPTDGLNAYRARYEPTASSMLESAGDDPIALYRVYSQYLISDSGKSAAIRLIDIYFEDGQFPAAAWMGEQLLRLHPNLLVERPAIIFRTAMAFHFCGEDEKSKALLDELKKNFPQATARIRGKDALLVDALGQELAAAVQDAQPAPADSWPTFAGSMDRGRISTATGRPGAKLYSIELIKPNFKPMSPQQRRDLEAHDEQDRTEGLTLGIIPVIDRGELFFQDGSHVYAVSLESGVPLAGWATTYSGDRRGIYTLGTPWGFPRDKQLTLTVTDSNVLAVMGQGDRLAEQQMNAQGETKLVCLDRLTGKEKWTVSPRQLPDDASAIRSLNFLGSPLVIGSSVYVIAGGGRGPQFNDCYVVCFDISSGTLRWSCYVASSSSTDNMNSERATAIDEPSHLAYAGGRIYVSTNIGAVAAVDALGGKVLWLATYPRDLMNDPAMGMVNLRGRFDQAGVMRQAIVKPWTYNAAIYKDGKVFALPADGKHVLIYDANDGREIKRISLEHLNDADTILGIIGPKLIVAGKRSMGDGKFVGTLMCLNWQTYDEAKFDRNDQSIFWPMQLPTAIFGRGFVTGESVFVTTQERLLRVVIKSGRLEETYPAYPRTWETGEGPGNVIVAPEHVIVAGSRRISVYTDITVATAKLDREIAASPDDPQPRLRYAELLFVAGQSGKAIEKLDEAIGRIGGLKSMQPGPARERVFNDSLTFAQKLENDSNTDASDTIYTLYDRAAAAAGSASQQVSWRVARAKFAHDRENYTSEVDLYQQILADESLRAVSMVDDASDGPAQAGTIAYKAIADLLKSNGPKWYDRFERAANDAFDTARDKKDSAALMDIALRYPNSTVAGKSLLTAAEVCENSGQLGQAALILRQVYFKYPELDRPKVIEAMARVYLAMPGRLDAAIARLSQGAKQTGNARLSQSLRLPDGKILSDVTFSEALAALQSYRGTEAAAVLPDFHLPPPLTSQERAAKKRLEAFSNDPPAPVISDVAALISPLRDFSRNDRVIAWSPVNGLSAIVVGESQPTAANATIDIKPRKIAWTKTATPADAKSPPGLLIWNNSQFASLQGDSLATNWKLSLSDVPAIEVLAPSSAEENADSHPPPPPQQAGPIRGVRRIINGRIVVVAQPVQVPAVAAQAAPSGPEAIVDVSPLGDRVILSTTAGRVMSIETATGKIAWQMRPIDRPIDRFIASEDFTVLRLTDDTNVQLIVLDSATGQVLGRKLFSIETNLVPINFALSADGRLVYTLQDRLCIKDLYEPWSAPPIEDPAGGGQDSPFAGADKPDQLVISEGRVLALSNGGQFVRMHSLETGRLLRFKLPDADRESDGLLNTGTKQWNATLRLVGAHLYIFSPESLNGYDLDHLELSWRGNMEAQTKQNIRDAYVGKDYIVLVGEPGVGRADAGEDRNPSQLRIQAYSRRINSLGKESGMLTISQPIADPSGIAGFQPVDGGFYYLSGDQKLHFLRGSRK